MARPTGYVLEISRLLYEDDPMGLAKMGAPEDEYDSEAQMIADRGRSCRSVELLQGVIQQVFGKMFAPMTPGPKERYDALASKIFKLLRHRK